MSDLSLQVLNRIEQLIRTYLDKSIIASFYIKRSGTTDVTPNVYTVISPENSKRLKLFIQNPSSSPSLLLVKLKDKNKEDIIFELTAGREFELSFENNRIYTGEVSIAANSSSVSFYAYEVERI